MTHLIQSTLILTLFYAAYRIIFERFTFFQHNRIFLLSGLGLSLALPFLPLNFSKERMEYIYLPKSYFENMPAEVSIETNSAFFWKEWTFSEWMLSVYLFGVVLFTFIMLLQIFQVSLLINKGNLIRKDGMKLVLTEKTTSPFSFFNTIVMNPKMLSEEQLGHILTHENIHISQWHQFDVVMAEMLKIVLWFFPVSWWYGKSIRTNLEFIADTNSLENGLDKKAYQLNLVSISQQPSGSVLVNNFSKKLIKHRIKMLNKMKTKKQILSFYAVLIPALVLVSIGISVQAQSQNEKVKQVIVLSDEKIEPENVRVQIKNENGEFQDLDSVNLKLIETTKFPDGSAVVMNFDGTISEFENQDIAFGRAATWEDLKEITPSEISTVDIMKDGKVDKIIITYKDVRKSDTIVRPSVGVQGYAYSFKDSDKILSPKELKLKIQKGEIDLDNPKNEWLKVWKEKGFNEPIEYSHYYKTPENIIFKKNNPINYKIFKTEDLQKIPEGMTFEIDSLLGPEQKMFFKNRKVTKTGDNTFSSDGIKIINFNTKGSKLVANYIGNAPSGYYIDGKKVSKKQFEKTTKNKNYRISHIISDDPKMIKKYGKGISKDGVALATKIN
ncbi:BlaR1 peptidase M56 [Moheibacter sediminis]|uniref:BlaR1 peptidase M56 n=2 Tax=Moheibacter sediminis TaxID=1434700 RepID=A0A1W1Y9J9_9FLAO|nr:BlaR1 peptidase M56 [Moheibacter sediminis]